MRFPSKEDSLHAAILKTFHGAVLKKFIEIWINAFFMNPYVSFIK